MSALPPEADMLIVGINVCYVPEAGHNTDLCARVGYVPPTDIVKVIPIQHLLRRTVGIGC